MDLDTKAGGVGGEAAAKHFAARESVVFHITAVFVAAKAPRTPSTPLGKRVRWSPLDGGVRRTVVAAACVAMGRMGFSFLEDFLEQCCVVDWFLVLLAFLQA